MKKKIVFLLVFLIVISLLTLSACDELSGASAYEIAIRNGFVGTELEWLESLKQGSSAYELAVSNGYTGTLVEWLASLYGTNGLNGSNGIDTLNIEDIFMAARSNGYEGDFLTFISEYLHYNQVAVDNTYAVSKASLSTVSILCSFNNGIKDYSTAGSGVIYKLDEDGNAYIITNYHVVFDKNSIQPSHISQNINIFLYGMEYSQYLINASYVGGSMTYDIAVLRISNSAILKDSAATAVTICSDNYVTPGQTAIAIGNPEAKGISASSGIVSVDSESIVMTGADDVTRVEFRVMRVDTAINSGNSGGGLYNVNGELIGIVNAKIIDNAIENIGYAIPINTAVSVTENILANCTNGSKTKMQRCLLGIKTKPITNKAYYDNATLKVSIIEKNEIVEILTTSIAKDKLLVGDILVSATFRDQTHALTRGYILVDIMLGAKVGETITFSILRNNVPMDFSITLTPDCVNEIV